LIPEVQGERAARFHRKTLESLADMVASIGLTHPRELQPHHLMHRVGPENAMTMDRIHAFIPSGALCDAPDDTIYAEWWAAARADSFRPATDLVTRRASSKPELNAD
jgi:hypothetical protein